MRRMSRKVKLKARQLMKSRAVLKKPLDGTNEAAIR
jgi:hypothetical protein